VLFWPGNGSSLPPFAAAAPGSADIDGDNWGNAEKKNGEKQDPGRLIHCTTAMHSEHRFGAGLPQTIAPFSDERNEGNWLLPP